MNKNSSLARWCGYAGIAGIVLGVVTGIMGLMNPINVYASTPFIFNVTTSSGRIAAILEGLGVLGFTASFIGFYLVGAVGDGMFGKVATWITAIGNLGSGLGFIHSAMIGSMSPLFTLSYLSLLGYILLTVAAIQAKRVSALKAWMPVIILAGVMLIELFIPINGFVDMIHQAVYGAMSFVVLSEADKS